MDTSKKELELNELESAAGGKGTTKRPRAGGSPTPLPYKEGYECHQITATDNLSRLANKYKTTVSELMNINSQWIKDKNMIMTGYYMYVPVVKN